jgi:hypothetical protein
VRRFGRFTVAGLAGCGMFALVWWLAEAVGGLSRPDAIAVAGPVAGFLAVGWPGGRPAMSSRPGKAMRLCLCRAGTRPPRYGRVQLHNGPQYTGMNFM